MRPKHIASPETNLIFIGQYQLGLHNFRLYGNPDSWGGNVDLMPEDGKTGKIVVGFGEKRYDDVYATLLHEVYEAVFLDLGCRYQARPGFSDESSNYMFFMSHNQLDEAHVRVSWFLTKASKDFQKAYVKFWRNKRKKKK